MSVKHSAPEMKHYKDIFSIFFNIKVCCVFSFESPYRGDSSGDRAILVRTHNTPLSISKKKKKKKKRNYVQRQ